MERAKKGDRVTIMFEGTRTYGVVKKGGSDEIRIVPDGGICVLEGHVSCFELSDQPLPKDPPNIMDKYSMKGYKSVGVGGDGKIFGCQICKDGKPFANVTQGGRGGPNEYNLLDYTDKKQSAILKQFFIDAKAWSKLFGYDAYESDDLWLEWWRCDRPYGKTAAGISNL